MKLSDAVAAQVPRIIDLVLAELGGGVLKRSVDYIVRGGTQLEVGESAPYAKYLENGTERMAARPHVKRTRDERSREAFLTLQRIPLAALKGKRR